MPTAQRISPLLYVCVGSMCLEITGSISYQLTGQKSNPIFSLIKIHLKERTVCLIQQVDYIE